MEGLRAKCFLYYSSGLNFYYLYNIQYMDFLFQVPRPIKRLISLFADFIFIVIAFWGAIFVRFESYEILHDKSVWLVLCGIIPLSLAVNVKIGLYRAIIRYISSKAAISVAISILSSTLLLVLLSFYSQASLPRSIPIIFASFLLILVGGSRLLIRAVLSTPKKSLKEKVVIYGAGSSGRQLAQSLIQGHEYFPVAFIDDDLRIQKSVIQSITVYGRQDLEYLIEKYEVKRILLAMPKESKKKIGRVLSKLENLPVEILSIPGSADLVSGAATIDELREVAIDDLLGREPVKPNKHLMQADIKSKVVMVTGAGGSIGSELCRQLLLQRPIKIVLLELSEFGLYKINNELQEQAKKLDIDVTIVPLIGSVQRKNRLLTIMRTFSVQTVYHAAAYKHVPVVEHNVVEGVRNNVFGTLYTAEAAIEAHVETFVLISTDKAVRPTNVMGTTKRMAELVLQALSQKHTETRFCMVRFGNILGSSGSVVPLFRKQIKQGGPITVTHPDIIRYFMTIPEAAQLVIQAGAMGKGGDVFVLDMGDPVKISELAKKMVRLSGMTLRESNDSSGDIEIVYTGLRPGEKLFEELLIGDDVTQTEHSRIMSAHESWLSWEALEKILIQLDDACHNFEHEVIRKLLLEAPTGFVPKDGICDLVWSEKLKLAH